MICVLAAIEVPEGRREEFLEEFAKIVPKVRAEEGCIEYGPWVDLPTNLDVQPPERTNVVMAVEKWDSLEALEAHLVAPHMAEFRKATAHLRKGTSLQIIEPA
jgi:quinol monooxygenase YgiN